MGGVLARVAQRSQPRRVIQLAPGRTSAGTRAPPALARVQPLASCDRSCPSGRSAAAVGCWSRDRRRWTEQVVVVAVAAAVSGGPGSGRAGRRGLISSMVRTWAWATRSLAEGHDRDAAVVDIEPDVEHDCLLKSLPSEPATVQVTRLTGGFLHSFNTDAQDSPGSEGSGPLFGLWRRSDNQHLCSRG